MSAQNARRAIESAVIARVGIAALVAVSETARDVYREALSHFAEAASQAPEPIQAAEYFGEILAADLEIL